ncbi:YraN family protein [Entomomonas moraniae]|uniref:UPF0102 protein DM558_07105 n=1 Tax=Entomomonas moraniae TaxID=2213226 RepID=A0A3Q9JIV0_9GAMM|nr:YraN family protein [Entomomonas moraniae]AZS50558.1 YraN family protein [Entomomonas moraniae]
MAKHLNSGKQAEDLALQYLQSQGLKLISRNWFSPFGEIDLIMLNKQILCFIEVRYRKSEQWGSTQETVTHTKRQKLIKTALLFLQKNARFTMSACQFDIVAITGSLDKPNINWLTNAFALS